MTVKAKHGYLKQLIEMARSRNLQGAGVYHVIVDDDCPMINDGVHRECSPNLTMCEGSA